MSTCISKEVICPQCGKAHAWRTWPGIEASANPDLREKILDGTLFCWQCPACGYEAQMVYPCLYHDRERQFMVYLEPNGDDTAVCGMEQRHPGTKKIRKRLVKTPQEWMEKILIFESGLDDMAVELVKLALHGLVERKYGGPVKQGYYRASDPTIEFIGFSFFVQGKEEPVSQGTSLEIYRKSQNILKGLGYREGLHVDREMAEAILNSAESEASFRS